MPRLVGIEQNGAHVGLLSTTDDRLIETLIALLKEHGTYTVKIISKERREPERLTFLQQFLQESKPE